MPITADTLRWYQSERMTDEDDGGGKMSAVEIVPGIENQVFDDLSDVDRAAGDVSIRKLYAAVASGDAAKYLDSGVVVFRPPADPAVSITVFDGQGHYSQRADLAGILESGIARGGRYDGWLWGDHVVGMRSLTLWQREGAPLPSVGARLELVAGGGATAEVSQVVWVTRIVSDLVERSDDKGVYRVRRLILELAEALTTSYVGTEPARVDPTAITTRLFSTRYVPEATKLCGIRPLTAPAALGDYTVQVDSLYTPLIPTALAETALAALAAGGASTLHVPSGGTLSYLTAEDVVRPGAALHLGSGVAPGTLDIRVGSVLLTDDGAGRILQGGIQIGVIDYGEGVCTWGENTLSFGSAGKTVRFTPCGTPSRLSETASQAVTVENRGYVWVITLTPIPAPGTLSVSYRAADSWYTLFDREGVLVGADSAYGSGVVNYATGTVTITTGAIPDPDSEILYAWSAAVGYFNRGGSALPGASFAGVTEHAGVAPGSVTLSWVVGETTITLTDDGAGRLVGVGGAGNITYATGAWEVTPEILPQVGTEVEVQYDWGPPVEETHTPLRDGEGRLPVTLAQVPRAGTVEVEWEVTLADLADQLNLTIEFVPDWRQQVGGQLGGNQ